MPDQSSWQSPSGAPHHEQAATFELGSQASQGAPVTTATSSTAVLQQPQQLQQMPATAVAPTTQSVAATGDGSDDERMWVERAKRIVEQTHTDPYLESQEIGKFKAEYLKDVHAKNIKVAEG